MDFDLAVFEYCTHTKSRMVNSTTFEYLACSYSEARTIFEYDRLGLLTDGDKKLIVRVGELKEEIRVEKNTRKGIRERHEEREKSLAPIFRLQKRLEEIDVEHQQARESAGWFGKGRIDRTYQERRKESQRDLEDLQRRLNEQVAQEGWFETEERLDWFAKKRKSSEAELSECRHALRHRIESRQKERRELERAEKERLEAEKRLFEHRWQINEETETAAHETLVEAFTHHVNLELVLESPEIARKHALEVSRLEMEKNRLTTELHEILAEISETRHDQMLGAIQCGILLPPETA